MVSEAAAVLSLLAAPVHVPLVETPPTVDCALDDAAWRGALVLDGFRQVHPGDNTPASRATEVRLALTPDALYAAVRAEEAPGRVRATLAKRDAIEGDDTVALYLDTFQDRRRAYVVMVNPLGVQQDGVFVEGREPDWSVDLDVRSAGCVSGDGYTVEVAIPLQSLRWQAGGWGLHVVRESRHSGEQDSWRPLRRDRVGADRGSTRELRARFLAQAGTVDGFQAARHRRTALLIPAATASRSDADGAAGALGATARFTPTSASSVDLAVNPDFAEVEADQPQVTANQRFPLFFAEKRPFFLEGAELFATPVRAFHSRSLVDPDLAVKATATRGRTSVVALAAADAAPGRVAADDPDAAALAGRRAYAGVVRARRDVGQQSSVGVIGTAWGIADESSLVGGVDGRIALGGSSVLTFQALGTASRLPEAGGLAERSGLGYAAEWARSGRRTSLQLAAEGYSPGYRAALGYTQRVDTNRLSALARYNGAARGPLVSWSVVDTTLVQFDWRGRMQYAYAYPRLLLTFPRQGYLNLSAYEDYMRVFADEFGGRFSGPRDERSSFYGGFTADGGIAPSQRLSVSALYDRSWGNLDFDLGAGPLYPRVSPAALADPAAPPDPGPGASESLAATLAWQPTEALRLSGTWERNRLVRDDTGRVAYDQALASLRAQYAFSRFASLRARLDYDSLDRGVFAQAVLGWSPRPGTVVYAGYDETGDFTEPDAPARASRYLRRTRTVYCKVSWAFRTGPRG